MEVRVGIPLTGGRLVGAARAAGYPVLFSANAFFVSHPVSDPRAGTFRKFKDIDFQQFEGLDASLDSAGYVAAVRYGDYRWTPEQYIELAASYPWSWYASMDYCVEKEIAGDRPLRLLRMAATAQLLGRLNRLADDKRITRPMPVIQGWTPEEYVECASWLPLAEWPSLVGVGSVCRRAVDGPDGLMTILEALDQVLPPNVRLHMFGVKSAALGRLAAHPRLASVDSQAWDFAARCERRVDRDMDFRIQHMHAWASKQHEIVAASEAATQLLDAPLPEAQRSLFPVESFQVDLDVPSNEALVLEALARTWADLLLSGDVEYADAVASARRDAYPLLARLHCEGLDSACQQTEEEFSGFSAHLLSIARRRRPDVFSQLAALAAESDAVEFQDSRCGERSRLRASH